MSMLKLVIVTGACGVVVVFAVVFTYDTLPGLLGRLC